jgi:hypothetical protein
MTGDPPVPDWREAAAAEYAARRTALVKSRRLAANRFKRVQEKLQSIETELEELDRGARVFGLALPDEGPPGIEDTVPYTAADIAAAIARTTPRQAEVRQFKDVALELLAQAYPSPLKAADVQQGASRALGRQFHWKTAGMTLYRLKNDYAVRRSGQDWYFVPEEQRDALRARDMLGEAADSSAWPTEAEAVAEMDKPVARWVRWDVPKEDEEADE